MATREQIAAARATVEAEIAELAPIVGVHSAYAKALSDGTRAMPAELGDLFERRVRWEQLTAARRQWQATDAQAQFGRMVRENDR